MSSLVYPGGVEEPDPLEGSSGSYKMDVKMENDEENTENFIPLDMLQLTINEPLDLNSTDAMPNPKTGQMVCLHCLDEMEKDFLTLHMVNVHNYKNVLFKCENCFITFSERKLLQSHKSCCKKGQKRAKKKTVKQIIKEVDTLLDDNESDNIPCPICMLELPKSDLKQHLIDIHSTPEVPMPCGICSKIFKSNLSLREHIKLVHNAVEDSVECEICGQKFSSHKYLMNHKRNVHPTGNKLHICDICGKQFKSRLCLTQHMKSVHPPESAAVPCPACRKTFKSRISLHQHLRVSHAQHSVAK